MLHLIYLFAIYPIELLLEIVFAIINNVWEIPGLSIIGVGIVVNILMLPLYNRADKISNQERMKQKEMKPYIDNIKKAFKGDERFMILQTYYRKQNYRPVYALRSSISLLLQIPFFIAAYHFLSNLNRLNAQNFLWIADLGKPDGIISIQNICLNLFPRTFTISEFSINCLPIFMTFVNILSVMVYTREATKKEKIQLYVMAVLFLCLLYNSPSGLVVYWTVNNIFSLIKNLIARYRVKKSTLSVHNQPAILIDEKQNIKEDKTILILGGLFLTLLMGGLIPSSVIVSSPAEFVNLTSYSNPLKYVLQSFLIAAGYFMLWIPVFYYLASGKTRAVIKGLYFIGGCIALVDFLAFGRVNQYISSMLKYDEDLVISTNAIVVNLVAVIICALIAIFIYRRRKLVMSVCVLFIVSTVVLTSVNIINSEIKIRDNLEQFQKDAEPYKGFSLSKAGKNVIVIMLDRAVGRYLPFILNEKPELADVFSGFIYYPNTISHGTCTIIGAPPLFGGYEYTPESMEARSDEKMVDKHDEALKVMPVVFSDNEYKTTVYDPPLGRYNNISDLSIYDEYPAIDAYSLKHRFMEPETMAFIEKYRERTFFMYSVYKVVPMFCQTIVYDEGKYWYPDTLEYPDMDLMDGLAILDRLIDLTTIEETDEDTFMMMNNETTHEACMLQLPDYTLEGNINNRGMETSYRTDAEGNTLKLDGYYHYHVNMAAILRVGKWLEFLKDNDVYDNTRIIIVSDHGAMTGEFEDMILEDDTDLLGFCPLLMFKDFNAKGFSVSDEFMTNGDTPYLAMNGLISNPTNPFTHKRIDIPDKNVPGQLTIYRPIDGFEPDRNLYTFFRTTDRIYRVHDDLYDRNNWARMQ